MRIRTIGYYFRETLLSLKRNSWLSLASASTVAISLLILGASLLIVMTTSNIASNLESNIEINVFINTTATKDQVNDIGVRIQKLPEVAEAVLVPKEDGLRELQKSLGEENKDLLNGMLYNPLPDTYKVKAKDPKVVENLAGKLEKINGIDKVRYGQNTVKQLFTITKWIKTVGIAIMAALSFGAVFLISTTIRLTVFARRKEINIMKFLGATDWFIRWPFLLEGVMIGLLGAVMSVVILYFSYNSLTANIVDSWQFLQLLEGNVVMGILLSLIGVGVLIGALGSVLSVRKFLKV